MLELPKFHEWWRVFWVNSVNSTISQLSLVDPLHGNKNDRVAVYGCLYCVWTRLYLVEVVVEITSSLWRFRIVATSVLPSWDKLKQNGLPLALHYLYMFNHLGTGSSNFDSRAPWLPFLHHTVHGQNLANQFYFTSSLYTICVSKKCVY